MAPGRKALRKILLAKEVTPGTAVTTATAALRVPTNGIEDQRETIYPEESVGILGGTTRSYNTNLGGKLTTPESPATFEQLPYFFAAAFGGPVTGVADGAGSTGFKYQTIFPTTALPTNTSYTIQAGDDFESEYMSYGKVVKIALKGVGGEALTVTSDWIGRQVTRQASFTSVSLVTVEEMLFSGAKVYLDAIGGTIGTTQVSNQVLGFECSFEAMWIPKWTADGLVYWSFAAYTDQKITGKITFEHDSQISGSAGEKANWRANTARLLRVQVLGSTYATPGTGTVFTGGKKGMNIDLPIAWSKFGTLDDQDGNDIVEGEFLAKYNPTAGTAGNVMITNEVSALP